MLTTEAKCIEYIHSLSKFGKKLGLANTELILQRLGNPHKKLKFIHIAGTNGKGSTSNMINNILISHNYKVGYYTSPYIECFNERICINNSLISSEDLVLYTNRVADVLDGITPIEFEFITAMAFLYFYEKNCDVVVLEVGLGGRFDATNVIDTPLCNVITPIGYDHTSILGDTLEKIAFEKSGTIKQGSKVVISPAMSKVCIPVIEKRCSETSSQLIIPEKKPENISYDILVKNCERGEDKIVDELVGIMIEILSVKSKYVRIGKEKYPYELVEKQFLKIEYEHILYILRCIKGTTSKILNVKAYMLAVLFNAPNTIDSFYQLEVNHDLSVWN